MIGRMPILRGHNERKGRLKFVGDGNDLVALRNGQCAAGQEVILNIHEDERFHGNSMNCGGT